jgi:hypothetical protein
VVRVGSTAPAGGGTTDGVTGSLSVVGGGAASLTLDDTGSNANRTVAVTAAAVTGLAPAAVAYTGLAALSVDLGTGTNATTVSATAAGTATTVRGNAGDDAFLVKSASPLPAVLAGPLAVDGNGGRNTLTVDDTADTTGRTVALTRGQIAGLGGPIGYADVAVLAVTLGSGADTVTTDEPDPNVATTLDAGDGTDAVSLTVAGDYAGGVTVRGAEGGAVNVGGDLTGPLPVFGSLSSVTVGRDLSAPLSLTGGLTTLAVGRHSAAPVSVGGGLATLTVGGDGPDQSRSTATSGRRPSRST